jgi:pyruvate kinase
MVRGISPLVVNVPDNGAEPRAWLAQAREWLFAHGLARADDQVVLLSASGVDGDNVDTLQTIRLKGCD